MCGALEIIEILGRAEGVPKFEIHVIDERLPLRRPAQKRMNSGRCLLRPTTLPISMSRASPVPISGSGPNIEKVSLKAGSGDQHRNALNEFKQS